jgi:hypothetical protein
MARHKIEIVSEGDNVTDSPELLGNDEKLYDISISGTTDLLFHAYSIQDVERKAKASKGSNEKKTDNLEAYTYRDGDGNLAIPALNLYASLADSARSFQDPRSPRKSLRDLARATIRIRPQMITLLPKRKTWDYVDQRRVVVQRSGVVRSRPAIRAGWKAQVQLLVTDNRMINEQLVHDLISKAGRAQGLGDFRPLFGLFRVDHFQEAKLT